jgi:hypothetical protein
MVLETEGFGRPRLGRLQKFPADSNQLAAE